YGLGSATGAIYQDTVRIGGISSPGQVFIAASSMNNVQPANVDGLLGLGFSALSWANSKVSGSLKGKSSFIENVNSNPSVRPANFQPAFGLFLEHTKSSDPNLVTSNGGELAIGSNVGNPARYAGQLNWASVPNTNAWWIISLNGVSWSPRSGQGASTLVSGSGYTAIVDSGGLGGGGIFGRVGGVFGYGGRNTDFGSAAGTSLITVDLKTAQTLNNALGAYGTGIPGLWGVNCQQIAQSSVVIHFNINGVDYPLTGADLVVPTYATQPSVCYAPFQVLNGADTTKSFILGEVFLRKYYSVYDYNYQNGKANPRVGFALAV
ncbi:aspartic peptidase domain-containing protein, partial [Blyttiomyces helicus]